MEIKNYFTYGDIESRNIGVRISNAPTIYPPIRKRTELDIFTVEGKEFQFSNTYTPREISIPLKLIGTFNNENIRKFSRIFATPQAKLSFSWDPDVYYIATPNNGELDEVFLEHGEGVIDFICKPYKYFYSGESFRPLNSIITNEYMETMPVIRFKGTGDINITLNGKTLKYKGLPNQTGWIYADSTIFQSYLENGTVISHLLDLSSDYPVLSNGSNAYSGTGNISAIEIKPNWREI